MKRVHHLRGFTLLEMLAAITVFAVLAAMAYGSLNALMRQHEQEEAQQRRLAELQRSFSLLEQDLLQWQPRGVREQHHGDPLPAFLAGADKEWAVEWTRGGRSNPGMARRSSLQRVAWHHDGDTLLRVHWPLLDRAPQPPMVTTPLLQGIEQAAWRFLDEHGDWHETWPPPARAGGDGDYAPVAVELVLELEDWGRIERLFVIHAP